MKKVLKKFLIICMCISIFTLTGCVNSNDKNQDYKKMVYVNDNLFTDTGKVYNGEPKDDCVWIVKTQVPFNSIPCDNLSSNFSNDCEVRFGNFNNQVYVFDDSEWRLFEIVGSWQTLNGEIEDISNDYILIGNKNSDGTWTDECQVYFSFCEEVPNGLIIGQKIAVTYDGCVLETYPSMINAYKIELIK